MRDILTYAAVHQNLFKRAATGDDKHNHGDGTDRVTDDIHDLFNRPAIASAESENRQHDGDKQRDGRVPDKLKEYPYRVGFGQCNFAHGGNGHQYDGDHRRKDTVPEGRHLLFGEQVRVKQPFRRRFFKAGQQF
ncbi:hypothetical protein SDC9_189467 [bioreactor metagenome]|uniref:Uncharacterized protein n=1 Tax=bioreactor metagenome TaxID=1076179 RepID=A0A645HTW5_9ZZZZ